MRAERVRGVDDPRLAPFRELRDAARLRARGLLAVDSRHAVRRLLAAGRFPLRALLATPRALEALRPLPPDGEAEAAVLVAEPALLDQVAGYRLHQGCLALAERGGPAAPEALCAAAARAGGPVVAVEGVADPRNLGSVFRNAHAFGAAAVLLAPGGADPLYRQAVRVSLGSTLEVPFAACPRWPEELEALRAAGFEVWALCADEGGPLPRQAPPARAALLLGGEERGLSPAARARADRRVRIPTVPGFDSLNVATASGIALHHVAGEGLACAS